MLMGYDGLWQNTNAMYAHGTKPRRTQMSGRKSEYFSEDGLLASEMAEAEVKAAY